MIRLQRVGKKNEPTFRIVVTDSKNSTKSGKFVEVIGSYDSREKNETKVDEDRVKHWMSQGAKVSDTLHNLFVSKGIIKGDKINVLPKKSPIVKEEEEKEEAPAEKTEEASDIPAEETPKQEEEPKEETPTEEKVEAAPVEEAKEEEKPTEETK